MKKHVPDPPHRQSPRTPFFTVQSDMYPPDALAHASELLRGVAETIEDDHKLLGAADYLNALAKALMNDIEIAKNRVH